ncbi:MAG: NAD(P)/FAD-dependent oxidoreductase [Undibacterium sp.]
MRQNDRYDVIVIGGGPAGMISAGRAAACGARVLLLEKNPDTGKKLLITGGGRSNVTNAEFDRNILLQKFGPAEKYLYSPFSIFGVFETLDFFKRLGMPTVTEAEKRVFPASGKASSVHEALKTYLKQSGVVVRTDAEVASFRCTAQSIQSVILASGEELLARSFVLATGGRSRPETGSTGDGFGWLRKLGHTVREPRPSLVPLKTKEPWVRSLSGLSFSDVKVTVFQNGEKRSSRSGKLLFTHVGLSGPLVLNMSRSISELLPYSNVTAEVDFFPARNLGELDRDIQVVFDEHKNKQVQNVLPLIVSPLLTPVLLKLAGIVSNKPVHSVTRDERRRAARLLKGLPLTVTGLLGPDKAIITSGGVSLDEVDFKSLRSRLIPNLYIVGDMLDIDRPSGGYSLQLCWTTGYVAGTAAAREK